MGCVLLETHAAASISPKPCGLSVATLPYWSHLKAWRGTCSQGPLAALLEDWPLQPHWGLAFLLLHSVSVLCRGSLYQVGGGA